MIDRNTRGIRIHFPIDQNRRLAADSPFRFAQHGSARRFGQFQMRRHLIIPPEQICVRIDVIDLLQTPQLAAGDQIVAVPTLVRHLPPPLKRIIGTLSDTEKVIVGLDLRPIRPPL